jgi:hypothetical protein
MEGKLIIFVSNPHGEQDEGYNLSLGIMSFF